MPIDRSTLITGPALVTFNSVAMYTVGDIVVTLEREVQRRNISAHGDVGADTMDRFFRVSFTPMSKISYLATLWPYAATLQGASLFTGTDRPLTIHTLSGTLYTFKAAANIKPPELNFGAGQDLYGSVDFLCIQQNNTAWSTADSLLAVTSSAFSDTSFVPGDIVRQSYTATWGASPFDSFRSKEGFKVTPNLETNALTIDEMGMIDHRFASFRCGVRGIPLLATEAGPLTRLAIQGGSAARGRALQADSADFVLTGTGLTFTINSAAMITAGYMFGAIPLRHGEVGWESTREFAAGAAQPIFTIA